MDSELLDMDFDYDLMRICRSCRRNDGDLRPIFESTLEGNNDATLLEMLTSCTQLQINYNDGMPPNVCSMCVADIKVAYSFRKRSEQSDMLLREYLARKRMEVDEPEEECRVKEEPLDIVDDESLIEEKYYVTILPTEQMDQSEEMLDLQDVEDNISGDPIVIKHRKGYSELEGGKFGCNSCEKVFPTKRGIASHVKQHLPTEIKKCTLCDRTFHTKYHFARHMKIHEDTSIQCDQCEKQIGSYNEYRKHMTLEHPGVPIQTQRNNSKPDLTFTPSVKLTKKQSTLEAICRICDTTFNLIAELRNHLKTHVDPKTFADVDFQTKSYLFEGDCVPDNYEDIIVKQVLRWNVHRFYQIVLLDGEELELSDSDSDPEEGDPPVEGIVRRDHPCALCNRSFPRIKTLLEHAKIHHRPEDLINCRHCSRGFPNNVLLSRHIRQQCENHSKKFFCSFCNEKFMWQTSLDKHVQSKHKPSKPLFVNLKPPKVAEKGKTNISSEKKFECPQCHEKVSNLSSHMQIHKKDTPSELASGNLQCKYCLRGFTQSSSLIVHMRRHTGERPYECDICDKAFPTSADLHTHRTTHFVEQPCLCTICGKAFLRPSKLARHMRIHAGAKPYPCTRCDRSYTQCTSLKTHQRATGHFDDDRIPIATEGGLTNAANNPVKSRKKATATTTALPVKIPTVESRPEAVSPSSALSDSESD